MTQREDGTEGMLKSPCCKSRVPAVYVREELMVGLTWSP